MLASKYIQVTHADDFLLMVNSLEKYSNIEMKTVVINLGDILKHFSHLK